MMTSERSADDRRNRKGTQVNVRLSDPSVHILERLVDELGLTRTGVLELLLREEARRRGMPIPGTGAWRAAEEEAKAKARAEIERIADAVARKLGSAPGKKR